MKWKVVFREISPNLFVRYISLLMYDESVEENVGLRKCPKGTENAWFYIKGNSQDW